MGRLILKNSYNPLYVWSRGLNVIQEAIAGGHADIVRILTDGNNQMVIDDYERTVEDYVTMKGSPIRPVFAWNELGIRRKLSSSDWNETTSFEISDICDIDIHYEDLSHEVFVKEYLQTGRPFILRDHVAKEELKAFSKARLNTTKHFHSAQKFRVGPTAYPSITNQKACQDYMSILDIERGVECQDMPGIPMVHAHHPQDYEWDELYPMYHGDIYQGAFRQIEEWFQLDPRNQGLS